MHTACVRRVRLIRSLGLAPLALFLVHSSSASAQAWTCEHARDILVNTDSSSRSDMFEALAKVVHTCGHSAPGWVARMLRQASPLSTTDSVARLGAWSLLDRRLIDSVRVLALDQTQTTERRRFFLNLLARYAAVDVVVDGGTMDSDAPAVLSTVVDPGGLLGTWPPNTESRNRARATIRQMSESDPDATLRRLAGYVYVELPDYMQ